MTNLEKLCKAFNWQGGTIYQASEELEKYLNSKELTNVVNLLNCNENALQVLIDLYKVRKESAS